MDVKLVGHMLRIFGSQRDEVIGWRSFITCTLSPSIIRMVKSGAMILPGLVAVVGDEGNGYRILVGKPEGKRPLRRI
jgi:hypothetical protein